MRAANNLNAALTTNLSQWMMIPQSLVTLDGSACNLVGTSYSAFYNQAVRGLLILNPQLQVVPTHWPGPQCRHGRQRPGLSACLLASWLPGSSWLTVPA